MITWLVGSSGSGKTYVAKALIKAYGGILLDADSNRKIWPELGYSMEDRRENNLRVARLARMLEDQDPSRPIVVATICPTKELRNEVQSICRCKFIFVTGGNNPSDVTFE